MQPRGVVTFLGQEVSRQVWLQEGQVKAVRYGAVLNVIDVAEIKVGDLRFSILLEDRNRDLNAVDIPAAAQAEADQIITSFVQTGR